MRCKICQSTFRSPPIEMREEQICGNCKSNQKINPDYYKNKLEKQNEKRKKSIIEFEKKKESISRKKGYVYSKKINENQGNKIFDECVLLIKNYKKRDISKHKSDLMEDMIDAYVEIGSLKKLCEVINRNVSEIQKDFRNLIRVPEKLREMVNENKLVSDPILAVEIAMYATDYHFWDQEETKTKKVMELAKKMAKIFNDNLELRREFFATNDDYDKPVSASTKKNQELQSILEDWPVKKSKFEFNRFYDRTGRQYKFIVIYSKDLDAAKFLRRWEYEKGRRISKIWASEMIDQIKSKGNAKEFVKEHSNEFKD